LTAEPERVGNLIVEPSGIDAWPWCVHGTAPHSAWIEFYRTREDAVEDARAMVERGAK
jgi:hypothetical protein